MRSIRWLPLLFAAVLFAFVGCEGPTGPAGAPGTDGTDGIDYNTTVADESCVLCHSDGAIVDIDSEIPIGTVGAGTHSRAVVEGYDVAVAGVDTTGNNLKVNVLVTKRSDGTPVNLVSNSQLRFTLAELVTATPPETDYWKSFYLRFDNSEPRYIRGDDTTATLVNNGTGDYTFTFGTGQGVAGKEGIVAGPTTPGTLDLTTMTGYTASAVHRIGVQISSSTGGIGNGLSNAVVDLVFTTGVETITAAIQKGVDVGFPTNSMSNQVATTASCLECHDADGDGVGLGFHGNARYSVEYCVTCHNPSMDLSVGLEFDMKQMIHRIHMGKNLPSVQAGATEVLQSTGFAKGGFPQEITNCQKCHDTTVAADAGNWSGVPSMEACGSCHDLVTFDGVASVGMSGDPITHPAVDNTECATCHPATSASNNKAITNVHRWSRIVAEAANWAYKINSATYTASTGAMKINFQVEKPVGTPTSLTGSSWTQGSASRLFLNIGWKNVGQADYTSPGANEAGPGSPMDVPIVDSGVLSTSVTTTATPNVYEVTATLPAEGQAAGTAIVFMDGHPAWNVLGFTTPVYDRIPVKNVLKEVAINDTSVSARRTVVANDLSACATCHDTLSLHGENRQGDVRICTTCHNSANTDIAYRPASGAADGKAEESVDFKRMIHRIHIGRAAASGGVTVYGFRSSVNVFAGEFPRGTPLNACTVCHETGTYKPMPAGIEGTTIDSGSVGHADDLNISPVTAVCSSCHQSGLATGHMLQMGGNFSVLEDDINYD